MRPSILVAVLVLAGCAPRQEVVVPDVPEAALCWTDASISDTAPGFELPKSAPAVLVVPPKGQTPFQQKLALELGAVVAAQGGVIVDSPQAADLIFSVDADFFESPEQRIVHSWASGVAVVGGAGRWSLSGSFLASVPLVMTKSVGYAKVQLDVFRPSGAALRHGWHGELQTSHWSAFRTNPRTCLNELMQRFGGPDGLVAQ